ncbi:MAG: RNA polymerase sigma-70 factor [Candidatus Cryptobacteroides sp.]
MIEKDTLNRLSQGDVNALDILYVAYASLVRNWCVSILKDSAEAEDLTQDIFIRIWNSRAEMREVRSFKSYLFRVTHNAVMNKIREKNVRMMFARSRSGDSLITEDSSGLMDTADLLGKINLSVEGMSELRKKIFKMSRFEDKTYQEIADTLGISPKTVQYHISCALAELRKLL